MPVSYEVHIDRASVDVFRGWTGPVGLAVLRLARMVRGDQRDAVVVKTGALHEAINVGRPGAWARGIQVDVGANPDGQLVGYAVFNELGTKPHPIVPKKPGGLLVFFWPKVGHVVHLRSVKHPGNRAYKWAERGLQSAMTRWDAG